MKHKKLTALLAVLAVSALGVGALSYYSGTAEKKQNDFNIVAGQKNQNDAGAIQEPAQDNGGKADAAAGLQPDQIVPKDPYIVSNVDWSAWAIMKVEVPKFTEEPNTGKPAAELLNVNVDGKQKLLRELDDAEKHTVVYGYTEPLAGNNSTKPESERAKTSSLFDSFKITGDISLANTYTGVIRVSGTLLQTEGHTTVDGAAEGDGVIPKSYAITYDLGENAVLSGQKTRYSSDDYGYTPPEPTRDNFDFTGWTPASIADGSTDTVNFTANWVKAATATIQNRKMSSKIGHSTTAIKRVIEKPDAAILIDDNKISTDDSEKPIYMWVDGTTANLYSEAKRLRLGDDCKLMFSYCENLVDISALSSFDTENVTNMYGMFIGCEKLTDLSPLSQQETTGVTDMSHMFGSCSSLLNISVPLSWNTQNVIDMNGMFNGCSGLTNLSAISSWDTGTVTNMSRMFCGCTNLSDLSGVASQNIENVTDMTEMFDSCSSITNLSALSNQNTKNVTNMTQMFKNCQNLATLSGISSWDTGNVTNMAAMFCDCTKLADASGINDQNILNVKQFGSMFDSCQTHPEFSRRTGTQYSGSFYPST